MRKQRTLFVPGSQYVLFGGTVLAKRRRSHPFGIGCMELHDRIMVGIRTERLELDEAWSFVGKKQKNVLRHEIHAKGDQYVFIGMAGTQKATQNKCAS
jgi:hypothetical protein